MKPTPPNQDTQGWRTLWTQPAVELGLLFLGAVWMVGLERLGVGGEAVGHPTRDLYDHIALLDGWSLHRTDWNFPSGGSIFPADPTGMLLSTPFQALGMGAAYSWSILLQLWLTAVAGWSLGRRWGSGLVAGAAFGLSPYLVGQAVSGEAETLVAWPLALVALLLERGGRRAAIAAGCVAALGAVSSWYHGVFLSTYMVLWLAARRRDVGPWRQDGWWAIASFAVVVLGPAWIYLNILQSSDQLFAGPTVRTYLSEHPQSMIGMVADPTAWIGLGQEGAAHTDLLGGVILVLAGTGLCSLWKAGGHARGMGLWWAGVIGVGLVMSLGPFLVVEGSIWLNWAPGRLLADLPVLGRMRLSHRWILLATLGLAVLAAYGGRRLAPLFAMMIVVESAWFAVPHRPSVDVSSPAIHAYVTGPVLDLPARTLGSDARGQYLVWQRSHGQPIPYALLMQAWSESLAAEPLVIALSALDSQDPIALRPAEARQFRQGDFAHEVGLWQAESDPARLKGAGSRLREMGLSQVILHLPLMDPDAGEQALSLLVQELGEPEVEREGALLWTL